MVCQVGRAVEKIVKGTYAAGADLFGVVVPDGITVSLEHDLWEGFQDACFYPNGPIATVSVVGIPVSVYLDNDGERKASYIDPDTEEETVLRDYMDFRNCLPMGEEDLDKFGNRLYWDMNPWFDLYQPPLVEGDVAIEHLDCVSHSFADGLSDAIREAVLWLPYVAIFAEDCPEEVLLEAVLSQDVKARDAALANPSCPESVRVTAVLTDR